jgi:hypothetical protein
MMDHLVRRDVAGNVGTGMVLGIVVVFGNGDPRQGWRAAVARIIGCPCVCALARSARP